MKLASVMIIATLSIAPLLSFADEPSFSASAGNHMSYGDAKAYCATLGGHLPNVREMATFATSQRASGIKETSLAGHVIGDPSVKAEIIQMASLGYQMVQKKGLWAPAVDFYYSASGFQEAQQAGDANLWTSSTDSSDSSLAGGMIALVRGSEEKFTLSSLNGNLGRDTASTGRNGVICAMGSTNAPIPNNSGAETTIVTINPAQIDFSANGKTLYATISNGDTKKVETVALDTSDLGRDANSIQIAKDYCTGVAEKAASANKNLRLDLSFQKPDKFCSVSDETIYPVSLSNAN